MALVLVSLAIAIEDATAARPAVALLLRAAVALLLVGRVSSQAAVDGDWVFDDSRTDTCAMRDDKPNDASCDCKYPGPLGV